MDSLKKLIFFLFLAYTANYVQGEMEMENSNKTSDKMPTFEWAKGFDKKGDGPFILNIGFPDGSNDQAVLMKNNPIKQNKHDKGDTDDVDPCILSGFLRDEDDVAVSVNGCPFAKCFEIGFDSSRLKKTMFKVCNGKVTHVSEEEIEGLKAKIDVLNNPHFDHEGLKKQVAREDSGASWSGHHHHHCGHCHHGRRCRCHCHHYHFTLTVSMLYSKQWYDKFKGGSVNVLRHLLNLVQNIFYWKSSPLRLTLRPCVIGYTGKSWTATAAHLNYLSATYWHYGTNYGCQLMLLMTYDGNKGGVLGITYRPAVCGYYRNRGVIAEFFHNYQYTSEILAHEIGHALGIGQDTGPKNRLRRDSAGHVCSGRGGVMDQLITWPTCWSSCSCEDWCHYYKFVLQTRDRFCLDCRDHYPFCAFVGTMASFFCNSAVVKRSCPKACGLCTNRPMTRNYGRRIVGNMKIGESGPAKEELSGITPEVVSNMEVDDEMDTPNEDLVD